MKGAAVVALAACSVLAGAQRPARADDAPPFDTVVLDPNCGNICYALALADVDGDGLQDVVAVTENRVICYRRPAGKAASTEWTKQVLIEDQTERDNVCIAPHDIDGDGKIDLALGAGWTKVGTIQWITRGKSPDEKWSVHFIDKEVWLHRMRFADVLGTGKPQLVISPLNRTQGNGVRLTAYEIPAAPKTDRWKPTVLDAGLNRMHNHWHLDADDDGRVETLTASQEGVHLVRRDKNGWAKTLLNRGAAGEKPEAQGAGEIKAGRLKNGTRLIATVEPMHGESAVVYVSAKSSDFGSGNSWTRHVLDATLKRGHAVACADLDGDGSDEVIVGHSDPGPGPVKGPGVYVYRCLDEAGAKWTKQVLDDGGMATEDLVAADLTGDGRIDVVAGGRNTHNIKLYVNRGPKR